MDWHQFKCTVQSMSASFPTVASKPPSAIVHTVPNPLVAWRGAMSTSCVICLASHPRRFPCGIQIHRGLIEPARETATFRPATSLQDGDHEDKECRACCDRAYIGSSGEGSSVWSEMQALRPLVLRTGDGKYSHKAHSPHPDSRISSQSVVNKATQGARKENK